MKDTKTRSMIETIMAFKKNYLYYCNNVSNYEDSINNVVKHYERIICKI